MSDTGHMTWAEDLSERFPAIDRAELTAHAADIGALVAALSRRHDLTVAEAGEVIDEWLAGVQMPAGAVLTRAA